MKAALPDIETVRLEEVRRYKILDTPPEEAFDDITRLAAQICETPIAVIGLVDRNRQWFKSKLGLTATEIPRNIDLCAHTLPREQVLVVTDTVADGRFATHPLVTGEPYIRFYASAPLISPHGYTLGVLCVMDYVPRELKPRQVEALNALSRQVIAQLELRRNLAELADATRESQQLERQLNHRQEELLDILENGTVGLHCVDANGIILWANQAEFDLLGYTREEYVGHPIAHFHADQAVIDDIFQRLSRNETLHNYEARLLCKDGSTRTVLIDSNARFVNGKFHHTRCFTRDITEYKRTREMAQQAVVENLRLARAIASVSDGVLITDPNQLDNPIIYANPAFSKITGYSTEEILGRNCRFLQGAGTDRETVAQIRQAIAERREIKTTLLNYRKDGQPFWNELKISPVFSEEGKLLYFVGIQTDITERKQAEEALRKSQERFQHIARATNDALWEWDLKTDAVWWNEGVQTLFGYSDAEVGLDVTWWYDLIHPEDRERVTLGLELVLNSGEASWSDTYRYRRADGSYAYVFD
ncbi:MAG: PAS domain S-box protein, partial [Coleofasciculus sp. S288]|nr:PAS domain S-box protein [Coleofasciculus sp. S288]